MGPSSMLQTSHILEQTDSHIIEAYGSTLPVVVTEILTISESKIMLSVMLNCMGTFGDVLNAPVNTFYEKSVPLMYDAIVE